MIVLLFVSFAAANVELLDSVGFESSPLEWLMQNLEFMLQAGLL